MPKPAVIVVNSLVARGSVGGRAAVFALERMGFPVWFVPTVLLPWHPGQGRGARLVSEPTAFRALIGDLAKSPKLVEVGAVLTGYVAEVSQVAAIAVLIEALNRVNPRALYLCDPVLGDGERLYVAEPIAAAIRDKLIPFAEILTPNRFELGHLTGRNIINNTAAIAAAREFGADEVLVTSAFAGDGEAASLLVTSATALLAVHGAVAAPPHGTGDLLAAVYLGHRLSGKATPQALEHAVAALVGMIGKAADMKADELPLAEAAETLAAAPAGVAIRRL